MLTKEQKDKWLAALRSGKYEQGQDYLCAYGKHCCLGVLCEVLEFRKWQNQQLVHYSFKDEKDFNRSIPLSLDILSKEEQRHLVCMNDVGTNFDKIADYIEENIPTEG